LLYQICGDRRLIVAADGLFYTSDILLYLDGRKTMVSKNESNFFL